MTQYKIYVWNERRQRWKTAYAKDAGSFYRNISLLTEYGLTARGRILE